MSDQRGGQRRQETECKDVKLSFSFVSGVLHLILKNNSKHILTLKLIPKLSVMSFGSNIFGRVMTESKSKRQFLKKFHKNCYHDSQLLSKDNLNPLTKKKELQYLIYQRAFAVSFHKI